MAWCQLKLVAGGDWWVNTDHVVSILVGEDDWGSPMVDCSAISLVGGEDRLVLGSPPDILSQLLGSAAT